MDETSVVIYGLPKTCNPVKIKLLFESECTVSIDCVKFEQEGAEVRLNSKKDADTFRQKLPKCIKFGGGSYDLKLSEKASSSTSKSITGNGTEPQKDVTDTIHSWYSLGELPPCKSGILVQTNDLEMSVEEIKDHFEDNQLSCGGPIAGVIHMVDGIFIFFKNEETATKVWDFRPHQISGKPVSIFLKSVPERFNEKLYVEVSNKSFDAEAIKIQFRGGSDLNIVPKAVKPYPPNIFLVVFDGSIDPKEVDAVMNNFKTLFGGKVSRLPKTDCLEAVGVSSNISDAEIKILFENKVRSGGGPVTRIDHVKGNSVLAYFASYQDADNVYEKFRGKTLPLFDCGMKIRRYFHCFYDLHKTIIESKTPGNQLNQIIPDTGIESNRSVTLYQQNHKQEETGSETNRSVTSYPQMTGGETNRFVTTYQQMTGGETNRSATPHQQIQEQGMKWGWSDEKVPSFSNSSPRSSLMGGDYNVDKEELIRVDHGKAKYLSQYSENFKEICFDRLVTCKEVNKQGMVLKGQAKQLREVTDEVRKMERTVIHRHEEIQKYGAGEFLRSKDGKDAVEKVSSRFKTVILVEENKSPKLQPQDGAKAFTHDVSTVQMGSLVVSVREGNIADETNDTIVCCTGPFFNLSSGRVSSAILAKGGQSIQDELTNMKKIDQYLRVTSSGRLPCKRIFHVVTPLLEKDLQPCLKNILQQAESRHCNSLSIPAIGTGIGGLPSSVVAKRMVDIFHDFAKKNPKGKYPARIDIVINHRSMLPDFKKALTKYYQGGSQNNLQERQGWPALSKQQGGASTTQRSMKFGPLIVSIRQGDITQEKNDAIVNSTARDFDLSFGMISKAIIKKGGHRIQQEVREAKGRSIRVTSAGNLPAKKIIHVVLPRTENDIVDCLVEILFVAEKNGCRSLSIPAIGTGNLRFPASTVVYLMVKAFREFAQKHKDTFRLEVVDIVIFDPAQLREFVNGFNTVQSDSKTKSWVSNIPHSVTSFFTETFGTSKLDDDFPRANFTAHTPASTGESSETDSVRVHMYSTNEDEIGKAWTWLKREIDDALVRETISDRDSRYYTTEGKRHIHDCGQKNGVMVTISGDQIVIEGLKRNVTRAVNEINNIIKAVKMTPSNTQTQSVYVWKSKDVDGWKSLPRAISDELENRYQISKDFRGEVWIDGKKVYLDLQGETLNEVPIQRELKDAWLKGP